MDITFDYKVVYFIKELKVDANSKSAFYVSLFFVFLFSLLSNLLFRDFRPIR